ncbi:uncharacterized protein LOC106073005 [Biomphalaria glabrata]|uniref:Uncharacterized protein LOC106073005 n=1 Tax=Biomphalaria glabrata TaxID=6526 RepID=A0A9W2Z370_BIOGL|nr:uncharacterized protein LOC106073005 [Biomphalaria glabrata]
MKSTAARESKDKQKTVSYKQKQPSESQRFSTKQSVKKSTKSEIPKADGKVSGPSKQDQKQEDIINAEENIFDQPTPELLELSDFTEVSAESGQKGAKQKAYQPSKSTKNKTKVPIKSRNLLSSKKSEKAKTKYQRINLAASRKQESSSENSYVAEKKMHSTKNTEDFVDTSDRLKEWISNLNVVASKHSEEKGDPIPSVSSHGHLVPLPLESLKSKDDAMHFQPLPVREVETQTLADIQAKKNRKLLRDERLKLKLETFKHKFDSLLEKQFSNATKIWRLAKEMQTFTENHASSSQNSCECPHSTKTGFNLPPNPKLSDDYMLNTTPGIENGYADGFDNQDALDTDMGSSSTKALSWLERELLHCEHIERNRRDVPQHVCSHAPCIYGNGFLQKNDSRQPTPRVAFVDECSADSRCSSPKRAPLRKRLSRFRLSLHVKKLSLKKQSKILTGKKKSTKAQYIVLFLLVFTQFWVQICYS